MNKMREKYSNGDYSGLNTKQVANWLKKMAKIVVPYFLQQKNPCKQLRGGGGVMAVLCWVRCCSAVSAVEWMYNSIPIFISPPTNQMSHQATMPTKQFYYLIIYWCNNPNIHIIFFSLILALNKAT